MFQTFSSNTFFKTIVEESEVPIHIARFPKPHSYAMKSGCVLYVPIWCFNVWAKTCLHSALEARLHWRALGAAARAFSIKCLRSMCNSVYRLKKRIPSTKAGGGPSAQSPNRNATTCALSPCNNITEHMQLPNLMREESNYMCPVTRQQHNITHPSAQSPKCASNTHM